MNQTAGQRRATDAVHAEMIKREWNKADLVDATGLDYGTVSDLLDYSRRIQASTQSKLESGLGWAPGTYRLISLGQLDAPEPLQGEPVGDDDEDEDTLLYRRPEGLTDKQWRELRARTRNLVEWEIQQALKEQGR